MMSPVLALKLPGCQRDSATARSPSDVAPRRPRYLTLASALLGVALIAGCGGEQPLLSPLTLPSSSTSVSDELETSIAVPPDATTSTTAASAPIDYRLLLLQPEDMAQPNQGYSVPDPATLNPEGIAGAEVMLTSNDETNAVGITIVILDSAASAPIELPKAVANLKTVVPTGPPVPVPVGDEAVAVTGQTPDGTKAATGLVFRHDKALVRIDFYSLPGTVTSPETVVEIGQKQVVALRVGLAGAR